MNDHKNMSVEDFAARTGIAVTAWGLNGTEQHITVFADGTAFWLDARGAAGPDLTSGNEKARAAARRAYDATNN
jgi:hypothetical protein